MNKLAAKNRLDVLQEIALKEYDLVVIGGGITGAGILLDAQSRGLNTLLIEMQDYAAGTSSRSTKLIHGGLRYLKQMEFALVSEVGKERKIVYENGMHTTRPEVMLLPLVKNGSIGKLGAWFGLWLYDLLAGVKKEERRKMLSKMETLTLEPLLDPSLVLGGAKYYEYRTDDARLTIDLIKAGVSLGGLALNYSKAVGYTYHSDGKISGVKAENLLDHGSFEVKAKCIVNATGPWVDHLDVLDDRKQGRKMFLTKGVHIVIDGSKLPIQNAMYFDSMDGRMVFAIPRDGKVYVGTTDTAYQGNIEHPLITPEDRTYLLEIVNQTFPNQHLSYADIESGWAGLRPLVKQKNNADPTAISRKDEIFQFPSGLITIAGGKLTGYRKMAERTVDIVSSRLKKSGKIIGLCKTEKLKISGGDFESEAQFEAFKKLKIKMGVELGISLQESTTLLYRYGSNIDKVFSIMQEINPKDLQKWNMPSIVLSQLKYGIEEEAVVSPSDFFIRRTSALYFNIAWVNEWKRAVNDYMADYFSWSQPIAKNYLAELDAYILEASSGV